MQRATRRDAREPTPEGRVFGQIFVTLYFVVRVFRSTVLREPSSLAQVAILFLAYIIQGTAKEPIWKYCPVPYMYLERFS